MAACQVAANYTSDDEEDLQLDYDEACDEVVEVENELRAEKLEVQKLLTRLKATGSRSAVPTGSSSLPSVTVSNPQEEQLAEELRRLFKWLAEHADLSDPEILDVGFEVPMGGRLVHLQQVVQWKLPSAPGGNLRVTAPIEHKEPLGNLLASTRKTGSVDSDAILHFQGGWDLVAGELTTAAHSHPEPSVLLSQRSSTQGILVATWPTKEALQVFHAVCPLAPRLGDRVEVDYEGTWYTGFLHAVQQNGMAAIRCDVDPPGVLTVTPMSRVRRLVSQPTPVATKVQQVEQTTVAVAEAASAMADRLSEVLASTEEELSSSGFQQQLARSHRRTRSSAL